MKNVRIKVRDGRICTSCVVEFILEYDAARSSNETTEQAKRTQVEGGACIGMMLQAAYELGLSDARKKKARKSAKKEDAA